MFGTDSEGETMAQKKSRHELLYPLGVTPMADEIKILVRAEGEDVKLLLFKKGAEEAEEVITFKKEERIGDVWSMTLKGHDLKNMEYGFEVDGSWLADPCARAVTGWEEWGDFSRAEKRVKARLIAEDFDWECDKRPEIPYAETIIYRLHVRGFTKHLSSRVKAKGTFVGVMEKIPYLKELGITAVELMPVTEFNEIMMTEALEQMPGQGQKPTGRLNYWGYGPSFLYAVKAAYGTGRKRPETEFKMLVKKLHEEQMECIVEMYFTGKEPVVQVLDVLRYWVQEYHVDGFCLTGFAPLTAIAEDPFLKRMKLFASSWGEVMERGPFRGYQTPGDGPVTVREKNLAEYNDQFQMDMRRFLKGDEGMINSLAFRSRRNPEGFGVINYMANTNGMTMMDMVTYDRKHNEENGEDNRDGNDFECSWNCGEEGPTRKQKIARLRKRQLCNGFLLLFLSQGTPLLLAGDEFGNSQNGNNNAYCQDNKTTWLDWKLLEKNHELYEFVKALIAFRKKHKLFHMDREPRMMDYKSCGRPDVSYHGENAWRPGFENYRRQFGILYWGPYEKNADGSADDTFYVAYNMHWEPHVFGLPRLPKGQLWHVVYDTSRGPEKGGYREGEEPVLENQTQAEIPPRGIMVFTSRNGSGYFTYETPIGEITVCCFGGAVTGLRFGRVAPEGTDIKEIRTELSDKAYEQILEYLNGTRKKFDLPIQMEGTEFQKKVWDALLTIPYGETRSYKEIAEQIGDVKATRAVGMANNKNPIAIVVPCHRVVGANGTLTGYAGGLDIKKKLLELEKNGCRGRESES